MKRIYLHFFSFCLLLLCSAPALAQHSGPYAGVYLGLNGLMNAQGSDTMGSFGLAFDSALQGSAVCGWDFESGNPLGEGRIELEYGHRRNPLDQVKFAEGSFKGEGNVIADSLLLNFFGVYHDKSRWSPYVNIGVGAATIKAAALQVTGQKLSNDSATVFAYQLGVGLEYALTDHLSIDCGYRFFKSTKPSFSEVDGKSFTMDYSVHSAVLGLKVGF